MSPKLSIWTIYDHPRDFPDVFIARRHDIDRGGSVATPDVVTSPSLTTLRVAMMTRGLTCIARAPADDPVIVESWL